MKAYFSYTHRFAMLIALAVLVCSGCKEDRETDSWPSDPVITLNTDKLPGHGQYIANHEYSTVDNNLSIDVNIASSGNIQSFTITKTKNLEVDPSFGLNGTLEVDAASIAQGKYTFEYNPELSDVNQLIGFTFRAVNAQNKSQEVDLTLKVNLSPRENLPIPRWQLRSVIFVNGETPNEETIEECNKDDYMILNPDGTWSMSYGVECFLEGLESWVSWSLSDDNKTLTMVKIPNVFQPDMTSTVEYQVKELTLTSLHIQMTVDMTALGGGPDDTFLYKYVAAPR